MTDERKPTILTDASFAPMREVERYRLLHGKLPSQCFYCDALDKEMRPYGPKGAYICFECAMKPERKAQTEAAFDALLTAAGPIAAIGEGCEDGPRPFGKGDQ